MGNQPVDPEDLYLEAFLRAFLSLEYLKLVDRSPSIVMVGNIQQFQFLVGQNWCKQVSGHLGTALKALLQLQDPAEEVFRLRAVSKVDSVDNQLLKRQLIDPPRDHRGHALDAAGLISGGEIIDAAYVLTEEDTSSWRVIQGKCDRSKELTSDDLGLPAIDALEQSDGIAIMCVRLGDSIGFFESLANRIEDGEVEVTAETVIVNSNLHLPHSNYTFQPDMVNGARKCYKRLSRILDDRLWISVTNEELSALTERRKPGELKTLSEQEWRDAARGLARELESNIVYHERSGAGIIDRESQNVTWQPSPDATTHHEYSPINLQGSGDVFNAAFLLALTTRISKERADDGVIVPASRPDLPTPRPLPSPPPLEGFDYHDCLAFAHAITWGRLRHLERLLHEEKDPFPPPTRYEMFDILYEGHTPPDSLDPDYLLQAFQQSPLDCLKAVFHLAAAEDDNGGKALLDIAQSPNCHPLLHLVCLNGLRHRDYSGKKTPVKTPDYRRVILWDLDNTLIPSKDNLHSSMWEALQELACVKVELADARNLRDMKHTRARALRLTDKLYNLNACFEGKPWVGGKKMGNFRRVWSSEEFYSVFHSVFADPQLYGEMMNDRFKPDEMPLDQLSLEKLLRQAIAAKATFDDEIQLACERFETTRVDLFDHVIEALENLRLLGMEHYIVTEGADANQLWKWQNSRLREMIPAQNVLTSYKAGQSTMDLPAFDELIGELRRTSASVSGGEEELVTSLVEGLETIGVFVEDLMNKSKRDFYAIVLRAILLFPQRARHLLRLVRLAPIGEGSLKAVIVGDTYDKDIQPVKQLNANVGTVLVTILRDRFEKQMRKPEVVEAMGADKPDFIESTLIMVQTDLANEEVWQKRLDLVDCNALRFRPIRAKLEPDTIETFLTARESSVWGIKRVVDQLFEENARQIGWGSMIRSLMLIASDRTKDVEIRASALESVGQMWISDSTEDILVRGVEEVFANLAIPTEIRLLDGLLTTMERTGREKTLQWLVNCLNSPEGYTKLMYCEEPALAVCETIARRMPERILEI